MNARTKANPNGNQERSPKADRSAEISAESGTSMTLPKTTDADAAEADAAEADAAAATSMTMPKTPNAGASTGTAKTTPRSTPNAAGGMSIIRRGNTNASGNAAGTVAKSTPRSATNAVSGAPKAPQRTSLTDAAGPDPFTDAPAPLTMPFAPGDVIADKYQVIGLIGAGGVAFVIAALHLELGEMVALKFLRPESLAHEEVVARFATEARSAARIKSEHVCRVYDVGTLPDGAPFIVMEYLEGKDLSDMLRSKGKLPIKVAVDYVMQACEALACAHAAGIVHRDVKPENLFLTQQASNLSVIKVLDFGISKSALSAATQGKRRFARTMMPMGTPAYMSPEQIRACANVDARTDIWALGCVLFELVTGCCVFDAPTLMQLGAAILERDPIPLRKMLHEAPAGLEAIVARCLAKDPDKRYQNVAELAADLYLYGPRRARIAAERCAQILQSTTGVLIELSSIGPPPPAVSAAVTAATGATAPPADVSVPPAPKLPDISVTIDTDSAGHEPTVLAKRRTSSSAPTEAPPPLANPDPSSAPAISIGPQAGDRPSPKAASRNPIASAVSVARPATVPAPTKRRLGPALAIGVLAAGALVGALRFVPKAAPSAPPPTVAVTPKSDTARASDVTAIPAAQPTPAVADAPAPATTPSGDAVTQPSASAPVLASPSPSVAPAAVPDQARARRGRPYAAPARPGTKGKPGARTAAGDDEPDVGY